MSLLYFSLAAVAVIVYSLAVWRSLSAAPALIVFAWLFLGTVWVCFSVFYIETGVFIVEQLRWGYANAATLGYILSASFFLGGAWMAASQFRSTQATAPKICARESTAILLFLGAVLILSILYLNMSLSPIPLFDISVDRFDYWRLSRFPELRSLLGNTSSILAFAFGLCDLYARNRDRRWLGRASRGGVFAYFVYLVLIGHKFSALALGLLLFLTPRLVTQYPRIKVSRRLIGLVLLSGVLVGGLAYYHYAAVFNPYAANLHFGVLRALVYRALALQGHLWWGVWDARFAGHQGPTLDISDLATGMTELMLFLGANMTQASLERGVRFTMAYPGIAFYVLPSWFALPIQLAVGYGVGVMAVVVQRALRAGSVLTALVAMQLALWIQYALMMGVFAKVWNAPTLLAGAVLILACTGNFVLRQRHGLKHSHLVGGRPKKRYA